ncbi:MAG: hypothetical protein IJQ37_04585 [Clostridia bacterium]|nr:hypothetical protein [Clostridia bacterium]
MVEFIIVASISAAVLVATIILRIKSSRENDIYESVGGKVVEPGNLAMVILALGLNIWLMPYYDVYLGADIFSDVNTVEDIGVFVRIGFGAFLLLNFAALYVIAVRKIVFFDDKDYFIYCGLDNKTLKIGYGDCEYYTVDDLEDKCLFVRKYRILTIKTKYKTINTYLYYSGITEPSTIDFLEIIKKYNVPRKPTKFQQKKLEKETKRLEKEKNN